MDISEFHLVRVSRPLRLAVLSTLVAVAGAVHADGAAVNADQARARAIFEELIGIDSTHAHGSTGVARAIAARLTQAGFPAADLDLVEPEPGKGSLLVHVRGAGKQPARMVIGHIDVVEALPEDWSVPPFTLTERDGYFYGRGTEDMKSGVASAVSDLIRLRGEGWTPARDLYFAFTSDEEAGGTLNGVEWLLANRPALRKVEYVINLDAGGASARDGVPLIMKLQTSEKVYATWELEVTNPGGHSSLPTADNAIYRLAHGLTRLEEFHFPVHLTQTTRGFLRGIAPTQPEALRADLIVVADHDDAAAAARLSKVPVFNALLRTTCVATRLQAGHSESALPQRAVATIQCRVMPGEDIAGIEATISRTVADPAIHIHAVGPATASPETVVNEALLAGITRLTQTQWPRLPVVLSMGVGASDSVYPANLGIPAYGVSGMVTDYDDLRMHGRDERVRVTAFYGEVDFTYGLIKYLGQP